MPNSDELIAIVDRILNGSRDESEVAQLRQWLKVSGSTLQFVSQDGKFNTNIGQVQGGEIHIGDRIYQFDLEALRELLQPTTPLPNIDWQAVSQAMLEEQLRLTTNPLTSGEGISYRTEQVYVPLGLVERKRQTRRGEDVSPEQGSLLYEETEITQRFEHEQFLERVLQQGQSPKSGGKRIAIIGEPGSGKTTLLQQIAQWVSEQGEGAITIWVSLADLRGQELEPYLLERWLQAVARKLGQAEASPKVKDAFVAQFQQGLVWLLLDGVDEMQVSSGNPLAEISQQVRMGGLLSQARIVLSCRLNLWDGNNNALDTFDTYRTLEFSYPQQVEQFVGQSFGALPEGQGEQAERLCAALKEPGKERIRDLVKNPLRLMLLCFNWYLGEGTLPETKAGLYEQFVADFYEWKREHFSTTVKQQRQLNAALGELAREAIDREATRFRLRHEFVYEFLGEPDEPDSLFGLALRLGWLNKVGVEAENPRKGVYAFFHPTFQEYFASLAIDDWHFFLNDIPENPNHPDANYRVFETNWREIIIVWFGRKDAKVSRQQKEQLIKVLITFEDISRRYGFYTKQAYLLAAVCIGQYENYDENEIVTQVAKWVFGYFDLVQRQWIRFTYIIEKEARLALLLTNRRAAVSALTSLIPTIQHELILLNAIKCLQEIEPSNPIVLNTLAKLAEFKQDKFVCQFATEIWWDIDPGNKSLIKKIVELDIEDELGNRGLRVKIEKFDKAVAVDIFTELVKSARTDLNRFDAAVRLGKIDNNNTTAIVTLIAFIHRIDIHHIESISLAKAASHWLGEIGTNNPEVVLALEKVIHDTQEPFIRAEAAISLAKVSHCNPIAFKVLEKLIYTVENKLALWEIAKCLGKMFPNHQKAIKTLEKLIKTVERDYNCLSMAWDLWEINPGNPLTACVLVQLIKYTQDDITRSLAINYLAKINNNQVITLLEELAQISENAFVRWRTTYELSKLFPENRLVKPVMEELAQTAQCIWTRYLAAESLLDVYPNNQIAIKTLLEIVSIWEKANFDADTYEQFSKASANATNRLTNNLNAIHMPSIVAALRKFISDENWKTNSEQFIGCHYIIWYCAKNMSYQNFFISWNSSLNT